MNENTNQNTQQTATPTPEGTGGKTFTQEEVNRIVSDRLAREREKLADNSEYKAQYEAVKQELEGIKSEQARTAKEAAVRAYYQQKGITDKALDIAMKGSTQEIDNLELTDGQIKDFSSIDALIDGVFSCLVARTVTRGADVTRPPVHYGGGSDQIADAFKPKI